MKNLIKKGKFISEKEQEFILMVKEKLLQNERKYNTNRFEIKRA